MYCVRVDIQFIGESVPTSVYLRFRTKNMAGGYSLWTENIREAKFWLYKNWAYSWLNIQNCQLNGEVLCLERDDDVLQAQKSMR